MNKSEGNLINSILFFISVFTLLFQDLPLASIFGSIAKCPNLFFAPLVFFYLVVKYKKFEFFEISKYYGLYSLITIITSLIMLIITVVFFTDGNFYIYSEFFPVKFLKAGFYNFLYFLTIFVFQKIVIYHFFYILDMIYFYYTILICTLNSIGDHSLLLYCNFYQDI